MRLTALLSLLLLMAACGPGHEEWESVINQANKQNLSFDSITNVDSLELAVSYYERNGTSNQRMSAYYLLASAYRDMGDLPRALQFFHDAADAADTTSNGCNFKLLSRVHGQMADMFTIHALRTLAINEFRLASYYALKSKDTLPAYIYFASQAPIYYHLHKPDSTLIICEQASKLFQQIGDTLSANTNIAPSIMVYADRGEFEKMKACLDKYEYKSHLTGKKSFIDDRHYLLYYYKGVYFTETHQNDSAAYYFYRLLQFGRSLNNKGLAIQGLYRLYKRIGITDSIAFYADKYSAICDSNNKALEHSMVQKQQMYYNYSQYQKRALSMEHEAWIRRLYFAITLSILLLVTFLFLVFYWRSKSRQYKYESRIKEYQLLLESKKNSLTQRTTEENNAKKAIEDSYCRKILLEKIRKEEVANNDLWNQVETEINTIYPGFSTCLHKYLPNINHNYYRICLGVKFLLEPREISILAAVSKQTVSSARSRMYEKVFHQKGTPEAFDEFIKSIP